MLSNLSLSRPAPRQSQREVPLPPPLPPAGSKGARLLTADEAGGLQDLLLLLLLATQVGEGVDDHAKDEVQDDDDDDEVKQQVVHDAGGEQRLLKIARKVQTFLKQSLCTTITFSQTIKESTSSTVDIF